MNTSPDIRILEIVAQIVTAHVSNNKVDPESLPELVTQTYEALAKHSGLHVNNEAQKETLIAAVPIEDSVTPDYVICLEDGRKLKMLKRHLKTAYNMNPAQYRQRWGLPEDYPMVAPNYAKKRSEIARSYKLGCS